MIVIQKTVAIVPVDTYSAYLLIPTKDEGVEAIFHLEQNNGDLHAFIARWQKYAELAKIPIATKLTEPHKFYHRRGPGLDQAAWYRETGQTDVQP